MNIDIEALRNMDQAIDPVIEAEDFKRQGNDALKKGNQYRVAAIKLYTRAIKCNVADEKKRSVYSSGNREEYQMANVSRLYGKNH